MSTIRSLFNVFSLYLSFGFLHGLRAFLRILILPFWKIDKAFPKKGVIIDIGCGDGGLTNYLALKNRNRIMVGIDMSKDRIGLAKKTVKNRKNIQFIKENAVTMSFNKADGKLLVDVFHHISFHDQEILLKSLSKKMDKNALLVIKEVDNSNFLPFWFGHVIEKILYTGQTIYTRSKEDWLVLFTSLDLSCKIESGSLFFPDSTLIFICKKI